LHGSNPEPLMSALGQKQTFRTAARNLIIRATSSLLEAGTKSTA
jgi:hypothetical protein